MWVFRDRAVPVVLDLKKYSTANFYQSSVLKAPCAEPSVQGSLPRHPGNFSVQLGPEHCTPKARLSKTVWRSCSWRDKAPVAWYRRVLFEEIIWSTKKVLAIVYNNPKAELFPCRGDEPTLHRITALFFLERGERRYTHLILLSSPQKTGLVSLCSSHNAQWTVPDVITHRAGSIGKELWGNAVFQRIEEFGEYKLTAHP